MTTLSFNLTLWYDDVSPVDHVEQGLSRFTSKYQGDLPRLQSLASALLQEIQNIDDLWYDMLARRSPLTAEGVNLDILGNIVKFARPDGATDDEYRIFILAKVYANFADGLTEDIYKIFSLIGVTETVRISTDDKPQALIQATGVDFPKSTDLILEIAYPVGVRVDSFMSDEPDENVFQFSSEYNVTQSDDNNGTTSIYDTSVGGYLAQGFNR